MQDEVIESSSRATECSGDTTDEEYPPDALYDGHQEEYTIIELDSHHSVDDSDVDDGSPIYPNESELLNVLRQLQQHTDRYNDIDDEDILRSPGINSSTLSGSRWSDDVEEFKFVESML